MLQISMGPTKIESENIDVAIDKPSESFDAANIIKLKSTEKIAQSVCLSEAEVSLEISVERPTDQEASEVIVEFSDQQATSGNIHATGKPMEESQSDFNFTKDFEQSSVELSATVKLINQVTAQMQLSEEITELQVEMDKESNTANAEVQILLKATEQMHLAITQEQSAEVTSEAVFQKEFPTDTSNLVINLVGKEKNVVDIQMSEEFGTLEVDIEQPGVEETCEVEVEIPQTESASSQIALKGTEVREVEITLAKEVLIADSHINAAIISKVSATTSIVQTEESVNVDKEISNPSEAHESEVLVSMQAKCESSATVVTSTKPLEETTMELTFNKGQELSKVEALLPVVEKSTVSAKVEVELKEETAEFAGVISRNMQEVHTESVQLELERKVAIVEESLAKTAAEVSIAKVEDSDIFETVRLVGPSDQIQLGISISEESVELAVDIEKPSDNELIEVDIEIGATESTTAIVSVSIGESVNTELTVARDQEFADEQHLLKIISTINTLTLVKHSETTTILSAEVGKKTDSETITATLVAPVTASQQQNVAKVGVAQTETEVEATKLEVSGDFAIQIAEKTTTTAQEHLKVEAAGEPIKICSLSSGHFTSLNFFRRRS